MKMSQQQRIGYGRRALVALLDAKPGGLSALQLGEILFPDDPIDSAICKSVMIQKFLRNKGQTLSVNFQGRRIHLLTERGRANAQKIRG